MSTGVFNENGDEDEYVDGNGYCDDVDDDGEYIEDDDDITWQ